MKRTILIVEDHDGVRTSLREWLGCAFPECRFLEATTGEEAVDLVCAQRPEIILMDIELPQINGIEATQRIKRIMPEAQVVMLTIHEASVYQTHAEAVGVSAYVLKRKMDTELIPVLRRCCLAES